MVWHRKQGESGLVAFATVRMTAMGLAETALEADGSYW